MSLYKWGWCVWKDVEWAEYIESSYLCMISLVPRRRKDERAPGVYCMRMRVDFQEILENRITNEYFRVTKTSQTCTIRLLIRISLRLQSDGVE